MYHFDQCLYIRSFREGIEEAKKWPKCTQNLGFECMHLIGQNKHSKFTCNTQCILPVRMTCAVPCWQTYLGRYSSASCHIWALKKTFEKSNLQVPMVAKIWVLYACINIWLARTNRQNWVEYLNFACKNDLCRAMLPDYLGTLSSTLCQISALKEAIG